MTASAIASVLSDSGTAGVAAALSMTTASLGAVTSVSALTGASTLATSGIPSFGYNGTGDITAVYQSNPFMAGIMATGARPVSIDLKSTAVTVTGSLALLNPWFALVGA
jgi:hypothetical protein